MTSRTFGGHRDHGSYIREPLPEDMESLASNFLSDSFLECHPHPTGSLVKCVPFVAITGPRDAVYLDFLRQAPTGAGVDVVMVYVRRPDGAHLAVGVGYRSRGRLIGIGHRAPGWLIDGLIERPVGRA